jgi:hypothetical protein
MGALASKPRNPDDEVNRALFTLKNALKGTMHSAAAPDVIFTTVTQLSVTYWQIQRQRMLCRYEDMQCDDYVRVCEAVAELNFTYGLKKCSTCVDDIKLHSLRCSQLMDLYLVIMKRVLDRKKVRRNAATNLAGDVTVVQSEVPPSPQIV